MDVTIEPATAAPVGRRAGGLRHPRRPVPLLVRLPAAAEGRLPGPGRQPGAPARGRRRADAARPAGLLGGHAGRLGGRRAAVAVRAPARALAGAAAAAVRRARSGRCCASWSPGRTGSTASRTRCWPARSTRPGRRARRRSRACRATTRPASAGPTRWPTPGRRRCSCGPASPRSTAAATTGLRCAGAAGDCGAEPRALRGRRGAGGVRLRSEWDREILRLAVPGARRALAEPVYVLSDTAIVGHLGTPQLAGLAVAAAILVTGYSIFIFLAYGTTAAVARLIGRRRRAGGDPPGGAGRLARGRGVGAGDAGRAGAGRPAGARVRRVRRRRRLRGDLPADQRARPAGGPA